VTVPLSLALVMDSGADPSGRAFQKLLSAAVCLLGLRVRILPGHGCLSLVSGVCCKDEVCASG
jgi:hypothetical protein